MTFLSALGTPIARRFEVWAPAPAAPGEPGALRFLSGRCDSGADLEAAYGAIQIPRREGQTHEGQNREGQNHNRGGILGQVARTGVPAVSNNSGANATESARNPAAGLKAVVALPIFDRRPAEIRRGLVPLTTRRTASKINLPCFTVP